MSPVHHAEQLSADLKIALTLAELLQRIEASQQTVGPAQYRHLVGHLARLLDTLPHDARLDALLKAFPAAAALYENQHYVWAGLCRSPLEASLNSEQAARRAIDKARKPA
jgi:ribosome assembly protein YihI (activator of Der GTPase)